MPCTGPPEQGNGLIKVFFVALALQCGDRVGELPPLGGASRALAVVLEGEYVR